MTNISTGTQGQTAVRMLCITKLNMEVCCHKGMHLIMAVNVPKKFLYKFSLMPLQFNLGYPATSEPAPIRISGLDGYASYAQTQQVQ